MSISQAKPFPATTCQAVGQTAGRQYYFGVYQGVPIDRAIYQAAVLMSFALEQYQDLDPDAAFSKCKYWTIRHLLESSQALLFASIEGVYSVSVILRPSGK
jgi:hypothetical protein